MTNDTEDRRSRKTWSGDHFDDSDECISQMTECLDTFKGLKIEKFDRKWKFPLESEAEVENEFSDIEYQGDDGEEMHSGLIYGCIVGYDGAEYYDSIPVEMLPDKDSIDDSEGDDDTRACLPCPFCYIGIEVHALCSHLQEEHCFDLKNAVCPLCAASLGKDVTGHFIAQHTTSIKEKTPKVGRPDWWFTNARQRTELVSRVSNQ